MPGAIVTDAGNFPTDRYVLEGVAAQRGVELRLFDGRPGRGPDRRRSRARLCRGRRGARLPLARRLPLGRGRRPARITALAHELGAVVIWDLSHAAGAVPIDAQAGGVELAVGCTYKYLNAGPGAPAYLYVRRDLQDRLRSPIQGWFGQRDQFAMGPRYEPAEGVERFLAGTPPMLGLVSARAGVELVLEAGIDAIRRKSAALTGLTVALDDEWLAALGFGVASPRDPERRGGHVSLAHDDGWRICRALIERAAVVPDFRPPNAVRLGFPPLYSRFVDVWDALDRLAGLVASGVHLEVDATLRRVT